MPTTIPSEGAQALPCVAAPSANLVLDRQQCLRLDQSLHREWWESDGLGGYASSTALLCPTRRYHGLLVAPAPGVGSEPLERFVFLSRFEEELSAHSRTFPLSNARYGQVYAPEGFQAIQEFQALPCPTWVYRLGTAVIRRSIMSVRGSHTVLVRYSLEGGPEDGFELSLRPLLAFRSSHDLTAENMNLNQRVERLERGNLQFQPYASLPPMGLTLGTSPSTFLADPVWYRGIEYAADRSRGFEAEEDLFSPGTINLRLTPGAAVVVAASLEALPESTENLWQAELERRERAETHTQTHARGDRLLASLEQAAETFLYHDAAGRPGVQAGLPWFGEWGRDTFVALPGLTLYCGRPDRSLTVLEGALPFLKDGLLPNIFGSTPEDSKYGSADAALWFARAVQLHHRATHHDGLVRSRFRAPLTAIADAYMAGTLLGLAVDQEGLLLVGEEDLGATWMDARTDGILATPRPGRPVELNALWYQLQMYLAELAELDEDRVAAKLWHDRAERTGAAFMAHFWSDELGYLADTVEDLPAGADFTIRPNAVLAASLEFSPLSRAERGDIVQRALGELLTPRGLRSLSPHDRRYIGRYEGGPEERDAAYHQGSVWPWLLGPMTEATLRAFPGNGPRVRKLAQVVHGMQSHLAEHGIGQISELFDGDSPHRAGGTPAQAWSVAEVLRAAAMLKERGA